MGVTIQKKGDNYIITMPEEDLKKSIQQTGLYYNRQFDEKALNKAINEFRENKKN